MPLVLALEPDPRQAAALKPILERRVGAELVIADSKDSAIGILAERVPDLILVTALLSPRDEAELNDHLRTLDGAGHVQTLTIPLLGSAPAKPAKKKRGLLGALRQSASDGPVSEGCDPAVFADEIRAYIDRATELKVEAAAAGLRPSRLAEPSNGAGPARPRPQDGAAEPALASGSSSYWSWDAPAAPETTPRPPGPAEALAAFEGTGGSAQPWDDPDTIPERLEQHAARAVVDPLDVLLRQPDHSESPAAAESLAALDAPFQAQPAPLPVDSGFSAASGFDAPIDDSPPMPALVSHADAANGSWGAEEASLAAVVTEGPAVTARPADEDEAIADEHAPFAEAEALLIHEAQERARLEAEAAERERAARQEAEQARADAVERERLAGEAEERERRALEQVAREQAERERIAREAEERERVAREDAEQAREAAAERERLARDAQERERLAREEADRERAERARAEREAEERTRLARATERRERLARLMAERERAERERLAREAEERQRIAREAEERERLAREEVARERAARERLEREVEEREQRALAEAARERAERERLAQEAAEERERLAREAEERERLAREEAARERAERERLAREAEERERAAREEAARERAERERVAREAAEERERLAREADERERQAREEARRERAERERLAREAEERERAAREEAQRERAERKRLAKEAEERERLAKEEAARERAERERLAREAEELARLTRAQADRELAELDQATHVLTTRVAQERAAREAAELERSRQQEEHARKAAHAEEDRERLLRELAAQREALAEAIRTAEMLKAATVQAQAAPQPGAGRSEAKRPPRLKRPRPATGPRRKPAARPKSPAAGRQDEWGIYDPAACGFEALYAKLEDAERAESQQSEEPTASDLLMRAPEKERPANGTARGRRRSPAPLSVWARRETSPAGGGAVPANGTAAANGAAKNGSHEISAILNALQLPPHVAWVRYASGCRIGRIRVKARRGGKRTGKKRTKTGRSDTPLIILSRRKLQELRGESSSQPATRLRQ